MKHKRAIAVVLAFMLVSAPVGARAAVTVAALNKSYWPIHDKYEAALEAGADADIIKYGGEIIALFTGGLDLYETAAKWKANGDLELNILNGVTLQTAQALERRGDYAAAGDAYKTALPFVVAWQELNAPQDAEFMRSIITNKITAYDAPAKLILEIAGDGGKVVFTGAKHEPRTHNSPISSPETRRSCSFNTSISVLRNGIPIGIVSLSRYIFFT